MNVSARKDPIFLCHKLELAVERLAVRPGPLPERLADLRLTLIAISPSHFPTNDLAREWAAIESALPDVKSAASIPEQTACGIACALLDLRTRLRQWIADQSRREGTAA